MNWETGKEKIKMGLLLLMKQGAVRLFLWCAVLVYIIESLGRHSVLGGLAFFIGGCLPCSTGTYLMVKSAF